MRLFRRPSGAVAAILIAATALIGTPAHAAGTVTAVPQGISALPGGSALTAAAARDGYCTAGDTSAVTVVVDFGSLGGGTLVRCASGLSRGANGVQALAAAGIALTGTNRYGSAFVCRLNGRPSADEPLTAGSDTNYLEQCVDTPTSDASWSYWAAADGGGWSYLTEGVSTHRVQLGGFEGWSFAAGDGTPPGVSPRLPAAPAPEPAPAPQPAPEPAPAPAPVAPTQAAAPAAPAPGPTGPTGGSGSNGGSGSGSGGSGSSDDQDGSDAGGYTTTPAAAGAPTTDPAAGDPPAASTEPAASEPVASDAATPATPSTDASATSAPTAVVSSSAPPATSSTAATATTAPTSADSATAAAASGGSGAGWWTIGGVVLLAALAGGGLVLARRRRVED